MSNYMKNVVEDLKSSGTEMSVEERNLLSVAYKNAVGSRRASWRIVTSVEQKENNKGNSDNEMRAEKYRHAIEKELDDICIKILGLLDDILIPGSNLAESKVFFFKMKGDYYRYQAEYKNDNEKQIASDAALKAYEQAMKHATGEGDAGLAVTHPIRLGLALNFSVFYYEVRNNPDDACKMARQAFEEAIAELDNVSEDSYKDSTLIMQLLRDNLTLWTSDADEAN